MKRIGMIGLIGILIAGCGQKTEEEANHRALLKLISEAEITQGQIPFDENMLTMQRNMASIALASEAQKEDSRISAATAKEKLEKDRLEYKNQLDAIRKIKCCNSGIQEVKDFMESDEIFRKLTKVRKKISSAIENNEAGNLEYLRREEADLDKSLRSKADLRFTRRINWFKEHPMKKK